MSHNMIKVLVIVLCQKTGNIWLIFAFFSLDFIKQELRPELNI